MDYKLKSQNLESEKKNMLTLPFPVFEAEYGDGNASSYFSDSEHKVPLPKELPWRRSPIYSRTHLLQIFPVHIQNFSGSSPVVDPHDDLRNHVLQTCLPSSLILAS